MTPKLFGGNFLENFDKNILTFFALNCECFSLTTMKTSMETTMVKNGYFISIWGKGRGANR
jgi:hypothetical protein